MGRGIKVKVIRKKDFSFLYFFFIEDAGKLRPRGLKIHGGVKCVSQAGIPSVLQLPG